MLGGEVPCGEAAADVCRVLALIEEDPQFLGDLADDTVRRSLAAVLEPVGD